MSFRKLTPNIIVNRVDSTVQWYQEVLGFETIATVPYGDDLGFAMVSQTDVVLMFQKQEMDSDPSFREMEIGGTISLYIDVDNLEFLYERCLSYHCRILKEIHSTFYGTREFVISDCNGYILIFAQDQ